MYDELRDHYRAALLRRIDRDGIGRSTMHVLEALLRLRQAACHPGLVDKRLAGEQSATGELGASPRRMVRRTAEPVRVGRKSRMTAWAARQIRAREV